MTTDSYGTFTVNAKRTCCPPVTLCGQNARLASLSSDEDVISLLWDAMDIRELVQSIAASGCFPEKSLSEIRRWTLEAKKSALDFDG